MNNGFMELTTNELVETDGGFAVWACVLGFCVGGCLTAGVYYGYKSEEHKYNG